MTVPHACIVLLLVAMTTWAGEALPALPPYPIPELPPVEAARMLAVRTSGPEAIAVCQLDADGPTRAIGYALAAESAGQESRLRLLALAAEAAEGGFQAHLLGLIRAACLDGRVPQREHGVGLRERARCTPGESLWLTLFDRRIAAERGDWASALAPLPAGGTDPQALAFLAALRAHDPRGAALQALEDPGTPAARHEALRASLATTTDEVLATRARWELVRQVGHAAPDAGAVEVWSRGPGRSPVGRALGAVLASRRLLLVEWDGPAGTASAAAAITALREPVPAGLEAVAAAVLRAIHEQLPQMRLALLDPGQPPARPRYGPGLGGWPDNNGSKNLPQVMVAGSPRTNWTLHLTLQQDGFADVRPPPPERLADATDDQRIWFQAWRICRQRGSESYPEVRGLPAKVRDEAIRAQVVDMVVYAAYMLGDQEVSRKTWDEVLAAYPKHPLVQRMRQLRADGTTATP